ncbi:MAG TPA: hypothetical protein VF753_16345, partial [Terriglobales bacterium]
MKARAFLRLSLNLLVATGLLAVALTPQPAEAAAARPAKPDTVTITVHPLNAPVTSQVDQLFTATVSGTSHKAVNWYVDGVLGGNTTIGTIDASGMYEPPTNFVVGPHTITAVTQNSSKHSGSATVYLTAYAGMYTSKNDNSRTGQNLQETILTPANVNVNTFGRLFSLTIDAGVQAQPLYVANVNLPNPQNGAAGYHNVIYIATENDTVYAYDADGKVSGALWKVSFIDPPTVVPVPGACLYTDGLLGISPTPVIDPNTNTMFVEVRTLENPTSQCSGTYVQRMHALDITTGEEKFGGPVVVQGQVAGTGEGSVNGVLSFDPYHENSRPGLLESQSAQDPDPIIYMGTA